MLRRLFPVILALCGVFLLLRIGLWAYKPLTIPTAETLADREFAHACRLPGIKDWGMEIGKSGAKASLDRAQKQWRALERDMRSSGTPKTEVEGVLRTARAHFGKPGSSADGFLYGVPVDAKRTWIRWKPVWVIRFGWGIGDASSDRGLTEPPSHKRVLVIDARKPFKILAMQTCG